jgi:hypothetical protein
MTKDQVCEGMLVKIFGQINIITKIEYCKNCNMLHYHTYLLSKQINEADTLTGFYLTPERFYKVNTKHGKL